jgi:hypothetical protein
MTKLSVAFRNFANAPNERSSNSPVQLGDLHNSKKWQCTSSCNTRLHMTSSKGNILQQVLLSNSINMKWSRLRLKCDGTHAKTRFCLLAKRTIPFKSAGASVQSTTGSRGVRISGSNAGYTMFRGNVKGTGYPLHSPVSPSLPQPGVTVCHHTSTGLYNTCTRCHNVCRSYNDHVSRIHNLRLFNHSYLIFRQWSQNSCRMKLFKLHLGL